MFHVETTAWEGEGAWKENGKAPRKSLRTETATAVTSSSLFADYGSYFWSKSN